jgi:transporter family protein
MALESASLLAVGAMICLGLSDFLNKRAMRAGVERGQFLVVQSVFFTVTTLVLIPLVGGIELSRELIYAIGAGAVTFVSYVLVLKALESGEASVVVPVYRMSFAVTVALAVVVLDEAVTGRRFLGFLLIVVALVTLTALNGRQPTEANLHSSEGIPLVKHVAGRRSMTLAAALAMVAMVTIGTKGFLYKVGVDEGAPPATFALIQSLTFLPIALVYATRDGDGIKFDRLTFQHAPYNGVLTALASVLLLMSLVDGDASVSVPISQLCFVVTAILAVILFREKVTWIKVGGVLAAVVAVLILSSTLPLPWGI